MLKCLPLAALAGSLLTFELVCLFAGTLLHVLGFSLTYSTDALSPPCAINLSHSCDAIFDFGCSFPNIKGSTSTYFVLAASERGKEIACCSGFETTIWGVTSKSFATSSWKYFVVEPSRFSSSPPVSLRGSSSSELVLPDSELPWFFNWV